MSNILWKSLIVSPAVLSATILVSTSAIAAPSAAQPETSGVEFSQPESTEVKEASAPQPSQIIAQAQPQTEVNVLDQVNRYASEGRNGNSQGQVTSVSQFSDVQPTDWAFQALQSLVERYGCIAGYPNGTYRGNRALTRYEFAAGLNACLDRVNELIATATADLVTKEDLATLQRLQEEFSAELATLRGRVDALEARTAELEANQFSTTTKLVGEAIFAVTDNFGGGKVARVNPATGLLVRDAQGNVIKDDVKNNTVLQNRVRLNLQTSFTGKDVLQTRLAAGNATTLNGALNSFEGTQTFNIGDTGNNNVTLDWLAYYMPFGERVQAYIAAAGGIHSDYAATNNPFFEDFDGGNGALSAFASESPIYRIGGGAGGALTFNLGKGGGILRPSSVTVGFLGSEASNPGTATERGTGLFNGDYAALGQLNFNLGDRIGLAATYVHGYHGAGSAIFDGGRLIGNGVGVVGTSQANLIRGVNSQGIPQAASSNSYGLSAAFRPSDRLSISGFVSYHDVTGYGRNDDFEAWSYGAGVALPDFGKKGNVLGIFAGAQPYALSQGGRGQRSVPYHVEGFYKYRVNDNISITPGVIWLTAPGQSNENDDAVIGTLRTTFTF
ncbi:iron uptake porin [Calothrix sp. NIES-3974]|uniref:iron uptake porin n=1 Tax=Calothrix sp. NIES-3974 TaxID=2005462 RepID=UPI000B5FA962|nr:iron uptake porin [Calothrix sp. NIES-3974]BAZ08079.1 carbohydrate-selective porin OprB [Calothrix sp. NIES-3974]